MSAHVFYTRTGAIYPQPVRATIEWKPTPAERKFILGRIYRQAVYQLNNAQIGVTRTP